jgi:hypothetical protein
LKNGVLGDLPVISLFRVWEVTTTRRCRHFGITSGLAVIRPERCGDDCFDDLALAEDLLRAVMIDNPFDQTWLE